VLGCFDGGTQADVLRRIAGRMAPEGFLFLGGGESLRDTRDFKAIEPQRGLYIRA
jgi:chemotaxis methyl-accepting protein methylase